MSTEKQKGAKSTNTEFPFKLGPEGHRPCLEGHDGAVAVGKERTTGHRQQHNERDSGQTKYRILTRHSDPEVTETCRLQY